MGRSRPRWGSRKCYRRSRRRRPCRSASRMPSSPSGSATLRAQMLADECTLTYGRKRRFVRHWHSERMPIPRPMTVEELARGTDAALTPHGRPPDTIGLVDVSVSVPADLRTAACRAAAKSNRVLVGVSDTPPEPTCQALLEELACTLVGGATAPELGQTCVA